MRNARTDPSEPIPRFDPVVTERLVIRPVTLDDIDAMWLRRNDESTAEYQAWDVPYPREHAEELITHVVACDGVPRGDGWFQLAVEDGTTGRSIGDLALHLTYAGRCAEIGYTFTPEARGSGFAVEAAAELCRWCFEALGVSRVSARLHPDNLASARVAERLGMVFESHSRNTFWLDRSDGTAENSDDWVYAMTRDDWVSWCTRPATSPSRVELAPVTHDNIRAALGLTTHRTQRRFVAPMEHSIADAFAPEPYEGNPVVPWPRLIVADGELVGFVMLSEPNERDPETALWRLLIDRRHQRRGVGRLVLDIVVEQARAWGSPYLETSWVPGPGTPEPFYRSAGFVPTGEVEDGEIVARLPLRG